MLTVNMPLQQDGPCTPSGSQTSQRVATKLLHTRFTVTDFVEKNRLTLSHTHTRIVL